MMKLTYPTQAQAQAVADRIHADLIATSPEYAASVAAGQTVRWAVPEKAGSSWAVAVSDRCRSVMTSAEIALIPEWQEG